MCAHVWCCRGSCVELSNNTTVIALTILTRRLTKTSRSKRPASEYGGKLCYCSSICYQCLSKGTVHSMCICGYTLLSQIVSHTAKAHYKTWQLLWHCIPWTCTEERFTKWFGYRIVVFACSDLHALKISPWGKGHSNAALITTLARHVNHREYQICQQLTATRTDLQSYITRTDLWQ